MEKRNFTFIDEQNLYFALRDDGWKLDYKKLRIYLKEKYFISKAYIFMGFIPSNHRLYNYLKLAGFVIIFKPVLQLSPKKIKGNCDAEMVLQVMIDLNNYNQAVIISGDGDFYCLIRHLIQQNKLLKILAPSKQNRSSLLKSLSSEKISFVTDLRQKLEYKKEPHKDLPL
ncbi:NYN domain-containing protein [Candidatus Uhrbacteria bacterium]|nr:NYN domain-containing protein [Candidatus Uhrbacteria bacterium]